MANARLGRPKSVATPPQSGLAHAPPPPPPSLPATEEDDYYGDEFDDEEEEGQTQADAQIGKQDVYNNDQIYLVIMHIY